jgi:chemosensory pili system protein ChpA (sensor histidine kinase/response regulator)
MQAIDQDLNAADIDLAVNHLGKLASALDALRTSLDFAVTALKRFVRQTESVQGSDLARLDASPLHIASLQLQQAVAVVELVGLAGPTLVLRAMEAAVQKFVLQPEQCSQEAAANIELASFALTDHLASILVDKPVSAVSLFPQYRAVQELVKADRIHPADLWAVQWRWLEPELNTSPEPRNYDTPSRTIFDQSVLKIMQGQAPQAAAALKDVCLGLSARQAARQPRIFWQIAAAYFEALAYSLLPSDVYVRRAASRVLLQYAALSKGDTGISDRLAQDLLFFCSQATTTTTPTPTLSAVRAVYGLAGSTAVDYEALLWGRFAPALLVQARRRIASVKETWSAVFAGDVSKFKTAADQFSLVADCLVKLHPPSEALALALVRAMDATARSGQAPTLELAMEVATSVRCLEAAFNDLDLSHAQLAARTQRLAERLEILKNSGLAQPLESWMEDLYRHASDKQTIGSVVAELRASLGKLEKSMEIFFRHPQETSALTSVPGQLAQIRGVLSALGLGQASHAVMRMRDSVEHLMATEFDGERARAAGTVDQLANNLGTLGFLIGLLNYQPALAKKLFVYDDVTGELRPLLGRAEKTFNLSPADEVPGRSISQARTSGVQAAGVPASQIEKVDVDSLSGTSGAPELSPVAAQQLVALTLEPTALVVPEDPPATDDEQVKLVGDLRIGVALYNLFLNEADECSRCLLAEVSAWAMERDLPVSDAVVSFAHALTASAATVGFTALSEMTRALEVALRLSQTHYSAAAAAQYADVFVNAAEDIRRLLHQFAAGFLKKSDPVLLSQLRVLAFSDA